MKRRAAIMALLSATLPRGAAAERLGDQLARFGHVEGQNLDLVNQYVDSALVSDATSRRSARVMTRLVHEARAR